MQIKHWLLVWIALSAPVVTADNSTFIDEHFARDSALVLLNGAVVSAAVEAICHIAVPGSQGRAFCQYFAPEATTLLYLAKTQWPTGVVEIWSSMNIALFAVAMVYLRHDHGSPVSKVRMAVTYMIYLQIAQIMANTAFHYLTGSNQTNLSVYISINSLSISLIAGGVALWLMYKQTPEYRPFDLFIVTTGTTLMLTLLYFYLDNSDEISSSEKAEVVTGVGTIVAVEAGAIVLAVDGDAAAADAIAIIVAAAGTVAEVVVVAGVVTAAGTVAGVAAGVFIIMLTGSTTSALRQWTTALPIANHLIMVVATGLPLMVNSWIISWSRFVAANATAHDTMQGEFIIPLSKLSALYPDNGMRLFQVWERSTD